MLDQHARTASSEPSHDLSGGSLMRCRQLAVQATFNTALALPLQHGHWDMGSLVMPELAVPGVAIARWDSRGTALQPLEDTPCPGHLER